MAQDQSVNYSVTWNSAGYRHHSGLLTLLLSPPAALTFICLVYILRADFMPFVFLEVRSSAFRETGSQVSRMAGVTREGEYWNCRFV